MLSKENLNLEIIKTVKKQLSLKINHLEKKNIDVDSPKEDHKEFIKNNKFMSKTQQRLISEKHNIFNKKN